MEVQISGTVDSSNGFRLFGGWVRCIEDGKSKPVSVVMYDGNTMLGEAEANLHRPDLKSDCGFMLQLRTDVVIDQIRSGGIRVVARAAGLEKQLTFYSGMLDAFKVRCLGKQLASSSDYIVRQLIEGLRVGTTSQLVKALAQTAEQSSYGSKINILSGVERTELSSFNLRVGSKSPDNTSVVGRDGTMFVLAGTNQLVTQYQQSQDDEVVQQTAAAWIALFRRRQEQLALLDTRYLQIIIPEKSSILPEHFPISIKAPTAMLTVINQLVEDESNLAADYIDFLQTAASDPRRTEVFRKVDSHLSPYGARLLILQVLGRLSVQLALSTSFGRRAVLEADLGNKFTGMPLLEEVHLPTQEDFKMYEAGLTQDEMRLPPDGRHIGTRIVWRNTSAPCKLRVVAFGNSFFERGGSATTLSWWAARCFEEFHFVWDPDVDYDYIRSVRPNVVICQTIERFTSRPASR